MIHSNNNLAANETYNFSAIVLAAGSSTRMGQNNKLLEHIENLPILHRVLDATTMSAVQQCVVVTGFEAERVHESIRGYNTEIIFNPEHTQGMSTSLRAGLTSLTLDTDAALIVLGDMPDIKSDSINQLIQSFNPAQGREICIPVYKGKRGNPVLWSRRFFPDLCSVTGDIGGRCLFEGFSEYIHKCPIADQSIHVDINTTDQLNARRIRK
ncbi:MAG: hypothetical protein DRJ50_09890 [Actinobacteria bacterium]|nr:MAG: hypothetical protein DRJ50_09890 [Actinomycetota bacterium]